MRRLSHFLLGAAQTISIRTRAWVRRKRKPISQERGVTRDRVAGKPLKPVAALRARASYSSVRRLSPCSRLTSSGSSTHLPERADLPRGKSPCQRGRGKGCSEQTTARNLSREHETRAGRHLPRADNDAGLSRVPKHVPRSAIGSRPSMASLVPTMRTSTHERKEQSGSRATAQGRKSLAAHHRT